MANKEGQPDVSRRDLGALLGVLGGAAGLAALASCSADAGTSEPVSGQEPTKRTSEALTGGGFLWFDTIVGATQSLRSVAGSDSGSGSTPVAVVGGYATQNDGGGGVFYWSTASGTDDGGTVIVPVSGGDAGPGATGACWKRIYSGPWDVRWFGVIADGSTDNATTLNNIIQALPATGGALQFPPGVTCFGTQLAWSNRTNVTFCGQGSRYMQDFDGPPSSLCFTGTGSSPAIHVSTNYARSWQVVDLDISYSSSSFTGSLIFLDTTAGVSFRRCSLGGNSVNSPYLSSAQSVVQIASGEKLLIQECLLQFASRCIWVPSAGAGNTALITIRDCQLGNVTVAHVVFESGNAWGTVIKDCLFDNTSIINPPNGLILYGDGFCVTGNLFSGGTEAKTPTTMYVSLYGYGEFSGNSLATNYPGIELNAGGSFHVSGNYALGDPPLTILGGAVSGGGNTWVATSNADAGSAVYGVLVNPGSAATTLDLGPDAFPNSSTWSYNVQPSAGGGTNGVIRYDPAFDSSTNGPGTNTPSVVLANQRLQSYYLPGAQSNGVAGGETTLASPTIPANSIDKTGRGFRFRAWGTTAANGAGKRIRILFSSTVLYDSGSPTANNIPWELHGVVYRGATSSSQMCFVEGHYNGAVVAPQYTAASIDLTTSQTFYVLGTGSIGSGDITLQGFEIDVVQ